MVQLSILTDSSGSSSDYRPPSIPDLSAESTLVLDYETTGLQWWGKDVPCGVGVGTIDGRRWYLPTRHTGGNLPEEQVVSWLRSDQGLRGKKLVAFKSTFEAHMSRALGLDLRSMGCSMMDVAHLAALLDDRRRELNLDSVSWEYLRKRKIGLDMTRGAHVYHASQVEEYALRDVELETELLNMLLPLVEEQGMMEVLALESACILPTVEMERNGAIIDMGKLERWIRDSQKDLLHTAFELRSAVGFAVDPLRRVDLVRMFDHLGLEIPRAQYGDPDYDPGLKDSEQKESFADQYLKRVKHPAIRHLRLARKLCSLRSKFLLVYYEEVKQHGVLRYGLNQLRSDDGGTISGRYSSSALANGPRVGVNIQQVAGKKTMNTLKEIDPMLLKYNIRELFLPAPGRRWLRSDAKQIEYRLFAHYACPESVIAAYRADPNVDYHNLVMEMIRKVFPSITRERTKDLNFAMLFGAGVKKIAYMIGISVPEAQGFVDAYMDAFPEAKQLREKAMNTMQERGWVKTLLGRRARYHGKEMLNSSLNRIIQGSAADINKEKIVEVDDVREELDLTMRFTVHDELDVDVPEDATVTRIQEVLNRQSFETEVPILWEVKTGANWAEAS